jgi:hypothetical protein
LHGAIKTNSSQFASPAADFQRADFFFGKWKTQICHGRISIQTRPNVQRAETANYAKYANGFNAKKL